MNISFIPFRSICGRALAGLHLLPRMATPFCGDGYTFRVKGCSLGERMVMGFGIELLLFDRGGALIVVLLPLCGHFLSNC